MIRNLWLDRLRGLLILSIVLRHVAGAGGNKLCTGEAAFMLSAISDILIAFQMPAFFILAGMCWKEGSVWRCYARKKALRLLVPYVVFAIFSWIVYDAVYAKWHEVGLQLLSVVHAGGWPNGDGFICNSVLWFLPAMFTTLMVYRALAPLIKLRIALSFVICVVVWFGRAVCYRYNVGCLPWGISALMWYLPYFIIGTIAKTWFKKVSCLRLGVMSLIFFVTIWCLKAWFPCRLACVQGFAFRIGLGLSGSCFSVAIAKARIWDVRFMKIIGRVLAAAGTGSLGIMLVHKFPVVALQEHVGCIRRMFDDNAQLAFVGMCFVFTASTVVSYCATIVFRRCVPCVIGESATDGK